MSGEDSGFLSLELPSQPMHFFVVALLRPPRGPDGEPRPVTLDYLHRHVALRLGELPSFRWRVQRVPLGLHHPVFVDDPDFDLGSHLNQMTLPDPGGPAELDEYCATQAARPMDRRRPLWQLTLLDGLQDGRQALLFQAHHCLMDGSAGMVTCARLFSGEDHQVIVPADPWRPEALPSRARLIMGALRDHRQTLRRLWRLGVKTRRGFIAVNRRQALAKVKVPKGDTDTPWCILNNGFSAERTVGHASLSLADVKYVKDAAGTTLNDVVLAVVAGTLRRYLEARDALPVRSLVAGVMVGLDLPGAPPRQSGNRVSSLTTSLATDILDPWERLRAIHEITAESKRVFEAMGPGLLLEWLEFVPPWVAEPSVRRLHRTREMKHPQKVTHNVGVSNLRGPDELWCLGPAAVDELYFGGPPNSGVGVNISLWSYNDRLMLGMLSYADSMNAPEEFAEGLRASLAELLELARKAQAEGTSEATGRPGDV